jgi:hypothetical protein
MLGGDIGAAFHYRHPDLAGVAIELTRNTLVVQTPICLFLDTPPAPRPPGADAPAKPIRLQASDNLLGGQFEVMEFYQSADFLSRRPPLDAGSAQDLLGRLIAWKEENNVYPKSISLLAHFVKSREPLPAGKSLADWNRFWGVRDTTAVRGEIRYRGGDLRSRALIQLVQVTAKDFRLQADSPGKGAGGRDLGADVDLVGPGPAYERWKKTPAYQQWLKDTRQVQRPTAAQPFVILAHGGTAEQPYDSLAEAVAAAKSGDTIEVRGDGPFRIGKAGVPIRRPLTIRAASGYQPVLQMVSTEAGEERSKSLLEAWAPLTLEGLTFDRTGAHEARSMNMGALTAYGGPLRMSNCRLLTRPSYFVVWLSGVSTADIRHCQFQSESAAAIVMDNFKTGDRLGVSHCLFDRGWSAAVIINPNQGHPPAASVQVQLVHNTLARPALGWYYDSTFRQIEVEAQGNVVISSPILQIRQAPGPKVWQDLVRKVRWSGRENLYPANQPLVELDDVGIKASSGFDTWNRLWERPEKDSRAATAKLKGGAGPHQSAAAREVDYWRLLPDSPGHHAGKDGHDLGADMGLLGPGPAYERWKTTPAYRQWLKDTGQIQEGKQSFQGRNRDPVQLGNRCSTLPHTTLAAGVEVTPPLRASPRTAGRRPRSRGRASPAAAGSGHLCRSWTG